MAPRHHRPQIHGRLGFAAAATIDPPSHVRGSIVRRERQARHALQKLHDRHTPFNRSH
jgi:hypothetical protein